MYGGTIEPFVKAVAGTAAARAERITIFGCMALSDQWMNDCVLEEQRASG